MDGKGRYMDNIFVERLWRSLKYEEVYLNAMPASPRPRPASAPGSPSITRSASTRAYAIARRAKHTRQNARGYVDDRVRRTGYAFAHIPAGTTANHRIDVDEEEDRSDAMTVATSAIGAGRATPYTELNWG